MTQLVRRKTSTRSCGTKAVVDDVAALRPSVRTIGEEAPRGSNGIYSGASQSNAHQAKVLKECLEGKRGHRIPNDFLVLPWRVEYAAM